MSYSEKSYINEEERKKLEKSEKEKKKEQEKLLQFEKKKAQIHEEEEAYNNLQKLRNLLEDHIIDDALVEKVLSGDEISHEEMEDIFDKIDEIEDIEDIDKYIPKDMRVTKDEFTAAIHNDEQYEKVLWKLHQVLWVISQHITPQTTGSVNLFSGFVTLLDRNLVTIQEHHIDMKDSLSNLKNNPLPKESIWSAFKNYFS